jgi:hypothetical protein
VGKGGLTALEFISVEAHIRNSRVHSNHDAYILSASTVSRLFEHVLADVTAYLAQAAATAVYRCRICQHWQLRGAHLSQAVVRPGQKPADTGLSEAERHAISVLAGEGVRRVWWRPQPQLF